MTGTELSIVTGQAPAVLDTDRHLSPAAAAAVAAGIPDSTRRAYDSDFRAYNGWCAAAGRTPLPATPGDRDRVRHPPHDRPLRPDRPSALPVLD